MKDGNNRSIPFNPGQNAERARGKMSGSENQQFMQRRSGRKNTVDPIGYVILFYVVLNLVLFLIFGWLYHSLDRKIVRLGEQLQAYELTISQLNQPPAEREGTSAPAIPGQAAPNVQNNSNNASGAAITSATSYTVVTGDTWWDICRRFYGDGSYYHKLIDFNKLKREDLIKGLVIQIPPKEELNSD
ncbi:MAG: LysM domain/BON superfamily protein [Firmicutes bacterium ADurb.Bin456]|nr:MAG: LysM domain/BON superfamily protein [Firmicutes bacterium ADurb.Bin456]